MKRKMPIPYIYCIVGGFALGLILTLRQLYIYHFVWEDMPQSEWWDIAATGLVNQTLWGFLIPLVFWVYVRFGIRKNMPFRKKMKAVGAGFLVAGFHEALSYVLWLGGLHVFGVKAFDSSSMDYIWRAFPAGLVLQLIEFWIIYGLFAAFDYARKYKNKQVELAQIEGQLSQAQLNALKNQLQPHFLFNTLNTISSLMDFDVKSSQTMVSKLGSLLRTVLDKKAKNVVPLREELEFTKTYLDIEQTRFHDRLTIDYAIENEVLDTLVPNLILQPLVENAIKHGFAAQSGNCRITVTAKATANQRVELSVKDNGKGTLIPVESLLQKGIGLQNTRDRLQIMYAERADLEVKTSGEGGFLVRIIIPK